MERKCMFQFINIFDSQDPFTQVMYSNVYKQKAIENLKKDKRDLYYLEQLIPRKDFRQLKKY